MRRAARRAESGNRGYAERVTGRGRRRRRLRHTQLHGRLRAGTHGRQGHSLEAHAGILHGNRSHFRSDIFRQIRDAEPIDHRNRSARPAAALQDGLPLHETRGWAVQGVAGWIRIRAGPVTPVCIRIGSIARAGINLNSRAAAFIACDDIFAPPDGATPARKNMRVKRLRFVGSLGFALRSESKNFSRVRGRQKQFSRPARSRWQLPGAT